MHMHMLWRAEAVLGRVDIDDKVGGLGREVNRKPPSAFPIAVMSHSAAPVGRQVLDRGQGRALRSARVRW
jgi:hypothetical protein